MGGFLFGFDTAVIAGAIGFITEHFRLNAWQQGSAVSGVLLGCMLRAGLAGRISDGCGRKKVLFAAAVLFVVTAVLVAMPWKLPGMDALWLVVNGILNWIGAWFPSLRGLIPQEMMQFVFARFLMGLAVGVESMLSPLYIAEIAPAKIRGRLVTLNHVALMIGMLCAYSVALAFQGMDSSVNWRYMFPLLRIDRSVYGRLRRCGT